MVWWFSEGWFESGWSWDGGFIVKWCDICDSIERVWFEESCSVGDFFWVVIDI